MVMDAGIATDDNLKLLKSEGYGYVCVSRSRLKDYQFCEMEPVHLVDNQGNPIDARVRVQRPLQICLECRSKSKKCDKQLTHIVRVRRSCFILFVYVHKCFGVVYNILKLSDLTMFCNKL